MNRAVIIHWTYKYLIKFYKVGKFSDMKKVTSLHKYAQNFSLDVTKHQVN